MPFTINGIGTGYSGSRNKETRCDRCTACGAETVLTSYDTRHCVVILFVPVIRLGWKRVIDECPRCQRHTVMTLEDWRRYRAERVADAMEPFRAEPADAAKAADALRWAAAMGDEDALLAAAALVEEHLSDDARTLRHLGDAYGRFGAHEDAAFAYRASLDAADSEETRDALAIAQMRGPRPDEALPHVEEILEQRHTEKSGYVYFLVEAYQAAGRHDDALELLQRCESAFPGEVRTPQHRYYRTQSEKLRATGHPVPPRRLTGGLLVQPSRSREAAGARQRFRLRLRHVVAAATVLLMIGVTYFAWALYVTGTRKVFVVNGTTRAYQVDLNGRTVHLPPEGRVELTLAEGDYTVSVQGAAVPVDDQSFRIKTPFWLSPFRKPTFVVNPDHTALMLWEETTYAPATSSSTGEERYEIRIGELLHSFDDVHYLFRQFPRTLKIDSGASEVRRRRIDQLGGHEPWEAVDLIVYELDQEQALTYLRQSAVFIGESAEHLELLGGLLTDEQMLRFLRPGLARRPLLIEWHRAYQDVMMRSGPDADVKAEYRAYLDENRDDAVRMYLFGRTLDDPDEQEEWFRRAIEAGLEVVYPQLWLVVGRLSTGRFEEALEMARQLSSIDPTNEQALHLKADALLALGRIEEALEANWELRRIDPANGFLVADRIAMLMRLGREEAADAEADAYLAKLSAEADAEVVQAWREYLDAVKRYQFGDAEGFGRTLIEWENPAMRFEAALTLGRPADALTALEGSALEDPSLHLLAAVGALLGGDRELAGRCISGAAEILSSSPDGEYRQMAEWLLRNDPPDPQRVIAARTAGRAKLAMVTYLGLKHPADRAVYFQFARRLNYDTQFPYLLIEQALVSAP